MAVPATRDMNNPPYPVSASRKVCWTRILADRTLPEAKRDLGWTTLMLWLPAPDTGDKCEMFIVRTLVRALRYQPVQRVRLNVGRGWQEGIVRVRRLIHRRLERVSCDGVMTHGRRYVRGG